MKKIGPEARIENPHLVHSKKGVMCGGRALEGNGDSLLETGRISHAVVEWLAHVFFVSFA